VEVDIVMDGNTPLWKAHDVSQQLQDKLEVLPNVERAFVHVDHEWTHVPVCCHPTCFISSNANVLCRNIEKLQKRQFKDALVTFTICP